MPIFWPIYKLFNGYLADNDIANIYLADKPIPISSLPIPIYRYRPNISANQYIGLSLLLTMLKIMAIIGEKADRMLGFVETLEKI